MQANVQAIEVLVRRISIVSHRPFNEVIERLSNAVGHPDMKAFHKGIMEADNVDELERLVQNATGAGELMEFYRFDSGEVLGKGQGAQKIKLMRFLIGNPVIMSRMAKTVPDAAAYAPVTILVHEREDGVYLSYDLMESLLTGYGSSSALEVAKDLDVKIEQLLETVI
ncbi:MAG TPA: DUF302 domain-containing protein [Niastella sp.]